MAIAVNVAGAAQIQVNTGGSFALETLGYTRNGADVTKEAFFLDVPGDANGGDDGPPIDIVYLGEIARIRLELTKWDNAIANKLRPRLYGGTLGQTGTPGTLMVGGSKTHRVLINTTNDDRNFPVCVLRMPIEINRGTKFSTLVLEFEAHSVSGLLYNAVTS